MTSWRKYPSLTVPFKRYFVRGMKTLLCPLADFMMRIRICPYLHILWSPYMFIPFYCTQENHLSGRVPDAIPDFLLLQVIDLWRKMDEYHHISFRYGIILWNDSLLRCSYCLFVMLWINEWNREVRPELLVPLPLLGFQRQGVIFRKRFFRSIDPFLKRSLDLLYSPTSGIFSTSSL